MGAAAGFLTRFFAAALVATPVDAKKHVSRHAPPAADQMVYGGSAAPRREAGGPIRSGNMCWKHEFGYTTRSQYGHWVPLATLTARPIASERCRRAPA